MAEKKINALAFCSKEENRPSMMKPMLYEGLIYATDGHLCLMCPPEFICDADIVKEPTPLHVKLIDEVKRQSSGENASLEIDLSEIKFKTEILTHEIIECDECNGDGECECDECGSTYDCKKCGGDGAIKGRKYDTPMEVIIERSSVQMIDGNTFPGVYFRARLLNRILQEIGPKWKIIKFEATKANLFIAGDIKMLVMPCRGPELHEEYASVIEYKIKSFENPAA
jgi:hypothetical protein